MARIAIRAYQAYRTLQPITDTPLLSVRQNMALNVPWSGLRGSGTSESLITGPFRRNFSHRTFDRISTGCPAECPRDVLRTEKWPLFAIPEDVLRKSHGILRTSGGLSSGCPEDVPG